MKSILTISNTIELICLVFALIFLLKDKKRFWHITALYMLLVCATELCSRVTAVIYHHHNIWIYNIYMLFEAAFISYGLYYFIKDYVKILGWILSSFCIILLSNAIFLYNYGINTYNTFTVSLMSIFFVIYSLLYFYLLLKDNNYVDLKNHPAFWWVGGVLIFYFGSTLCNLFEDVFRIKITPKTTLRSYIFYFLNAFLYGSWVYSFICRARQRKLPH